MKRWVGQAANTIDNYKPNIRQHIHLRLKGDRVVTVLVLRPSDIAELCPAKKMTGGFAWLQLPLAERHKKTADMAVN